ncbi:unnamed protein product [Schistocephalus solidus]|uniref:Reverse transcriptase domain-containing protein n=1 Tax=Schistocephalus solidus TaxID=70667 RepID=A0A183TD92_SCHSO|nr:unnamed protein product [Schistocephalus solidus]
MPLAVRPTAENRPHQQQMQLTKLWHSKTTASRYDGMTTRVMDNGAVSEAFAVTNGMKQSCVLTPTLFSLLCSAMLIDAYRGERPGIRITR